MVPSTTLVRATLSRVCFQKLNKSIRPFRSTQLLWNAEGTNNKSDAEDIAPRQYSTPELTADAAKSKAGMQDPTRPEWQNPLHHNNPDCMKIFREDFESEEAFRAAILPAPTDAPPEYLQELANEILNLTLLEMNELLNKLADHYGFHEGMMDPEEDGEAGGDEDIDAFDASAVPVKEVKASFDIKLVSYDEKSKIKVIKEIRSLAGLGLKEAKDMVEGAPKVVAKGLKQDEADAIKAKLEEIGATIEIV